MYVFLPFGCVILHAPLVKIVFIRFTPTFQCANMKFKINWNKTVLNIFGLLAKLTIPNIRRFMSEINGVF